MKNKVILLLFFVFLLAGFLRLYLLSSYMQLGGDEGWGYLVARDAILSGKLPLYGPDTSLGWFKLGPLSYYMLILSLIIGKFNPVSFAYVTAFSDVFSAFIIFFIGSAVLNKKTGLISSLMYAVSPFLIVHSRIPLHVNLVPFFSCLFYLFWFFLIKGKKQRKRNMYFYLSCFVFGILVQMHITPFLLLPVFLITLVNRLSVKSALLGLLSFFIPLIPYLHSEAMTRFEMTGKIILWFPYRILSSVGIFTEKNLLTPEKLYVSRSVYAGVLANSIFPAVPFVGMILIIFSIYFLYRRVNKKFSFPVIGSFFLATLGIFIHGQPAEHYLLYIVPLILISVSLWLSRVKFGNVILFIIICGNVLYFMSFGIRGGIPLSEKEKVVKKMIQESGKNTYKIVPSNDIINLPHYYDAYRYLGYYSGKEASVAGTVSYKIYEKAIPDFMLDFAKEIYRYDHITLVKF